MTRQGLLKRGAGLGAAVALVICFASRPALAADDASRESKRLADAREAYLGLMGVEEAGSVPAPLLEKCECVAVFPGVLKGAIGWGGRHGNGVMTCRDASGRWSPPSFMTLTGGSVGFQIGVEKADVVLFVMNAKGARALTEGGFTVGAKGSIAAGPVGRTAEGATDVRLDAEIYSYARAKGLFAGISLEGARIGNDEKAIARFYGARIPPDSLLFSKRDRALPSGAKAFLEVLPAR